MYGIRWASSFSVCASIFTEWKSWMDKNLFETFVSNRTNTTMYMILLQVYGFRWVCCSVVGFFSIAYVCMLQVPGNVFVFFSHRTMPLTNRLGFADMWNIFQLKRPLLNKNKNFIHFSWFIMHTEQVDDIESELNVMSNAHAPRSYIQSTILGIVLNFRTILPFNVIPYEIPILNGFRKLTGVLYTVQYAHTCIYILYYYDEHRVSMRYRIHCCP